MKHTEICGRQQQQYYREVHRNTGSPQEQEKVSNDQLNPAPKRTRKRTNKGTVILGEEKYERVGVICLLSEGTRKDLKNNSRLNTYVCLFIRSLLIEHSYRRYYICFIHLCASHLPQVGT